MRPAARDDCELLWRWANDPLARAASFDSRQIEWDEHVAWFQARLNDDSSRIYVVEESAQAVGVLRFELEERGNAVVSINIAPDARGRGLGPVALRQGCALVSERDAVTSVTAYIKADNVASRRAFDQAGFVLAGEVTLGDNAAVVTHWTAPVAGVDG